MIHQEFIIERYGWKVKIFYPVCRCTSEIMMELIRLGCEGDVLDSAYNLMTEDKDNTGFTYSSPEERTSLVMIGNPSSREQFANTLSHELGHVAMHISQFEYIDPYSEELAYLLGDLFFNAYRVAHTYLCPSCRKLENGSPLHEISYNIQ